MKKLISVLCISALSFSASAQLTEDQTGVEDAIEYSPLELFQVWGWLLGEQFNLTALDLNPGEVAAVQEGLKNYITSERPDINFQDAVPQLQRYISLREKRTKETMMQRGRDEEYEFFDQMVGSPNIQSLGTGLHFEILDKGSDVIPDESDIVKVHYHGTLINGKVFDSSVDRGEPSMFKLDTVILGWTQGLQLIGVGGKVKLYVPAKLAYGDEGKSGIPPASTLIFEVELLEIVDPATLQQNPAQ